MVKAKQVEEAAAPLEATVGKETLDETPNRALKLLRAAGTHRSIRALLNQKGYSDASHQEGWTLLHAASGYGGAGSGTDVDPVVANAVATLDALDEDLFAVVTATLKRAYPKVGAVMLDGIGASKGAAAVVGDKALLDRYDGLAASKEKDDKVAAALLASRVLPDSERPRLRDLINKAQANSASDPDAAKTAQGQGRRGPQLGPDRPSPLVRGMVGDRSGSSEAPRLPHPDGPRRPQGPKKKDQGGAAGGTTTTTPPAPTPTADPAAKKS